MTRRIAVAVLAAPAWTPPRLDPREWRLALAEDVLDVLARMAEVEAGIVVPTADAELVRAVGWPGLRAYLLDDWRISTVFAALAGDGYDQGVLIAGDAPDLPGMLIAKLLRPLSSHPVAAAGAVGRTGEALFGVSAVLPAPAWLPQATLDELTPGALRKLAPRPADVAAGTGWHRLLGPDDLARLDPRLEGWDATRALLSAR